MNEEKILQLIQEENPDNPLLYVKNLVKPMMINKINNYIKECDYCPNRYSGFKTIPYGNINANILIICEQPLQSQLQLDKDIVSVLEGTQEKEILSTVFEEYNVKEEQFYFVNMVNCLSKIIINNETIIRPFAFEELNSCKIYLDNLIEAMNPNLIICLGSSVFNVFSDTSFNKSKNNFFKIGFIDAIAIQSPTFLIQQREIKDEELCEQEELEFMEGFKKAFDFCNQNGWL
jgi:uracil DNA glycosylase superfamily